MLKHVDPKLHSDYIVERYKPSEPDVPDIGKFTQPKFMKGPSPLKSLKKISSLKHDHPVKRFVDKRKIPSTLHFELFFAPKFYEWVNKVVPNKFPSLKGDHPRWIPHGPLLEGKNIIASGKSGLLLISFASFRSW